jgi:hypothetical protein
VLPIKLLLSLQQKEINREFCLNQVFKGSSSDVNRFPIETETERVGRKRKNLFKYCSTKDGRESGLLKG